MRGDDGKAALAPETRISFHVPSCAPAGNYGISGDEQGCYAAEEETSKRQDSKHGYDWNGLEWRNTGSGAWARTLIGAVRLPLTTRGGPCNSDIHRRIVRDALTNQLIDDCYIDDTTDADISRLLPQPRDVRVELVVRDAAKWYRNRGPDVVELYSLPRIVREAGLRAYAGKRLKPGWS